MKKRKPDNVIYLSSIPKKRLPFLIIPSYENLSLIPKEDTIVKIKVYNKKNEIMVTLIKAVKRLINTHVFNYWKMCPVCKSTNTTQTSDHSTSGVNAFICNDCGTKFGN